jgi:outer membrane protein TolC
VTGVQTCALPIYQAVVEANQLIWDGGAIAAQKQMARADSEVEKSKVEVDLFALKERVNQLFFGVLLLDEQLKLTELLWSELDSNYKRLEALQLNGMANQADIDVLKVEQLNLTQRQTELKSTRNTYLVLLSAFIGQEIPNSASLVQPETDLSGFAISGINRPELKLFDAQLGLYDCQKQQLDAALKPRIGAFLQGGYGQPGLNMFSDGFSPFYLGGIRLSWALGAFYSNRINLSKLELSKQAVDVQRAAFLFNTNLKVAQHHAEIEKLKTLLSSDEEIIELRKRIKKTATAKVENGTFTTTDLVREINAENQARQLKSLHEIQLLMAIYNLKNTVNN